MKTQNASIVGQLNISAFSNQRQNSKAYVKSGAITSLDNGGLRYFVQDLVPKNFRATKNAHLKTISLKSTFEWLQNDPLLVLTCAEMGQNAPVGTFDDEPVLLDDKVDRHTFRSDRDSIS